MFHVDVDVDVDVLLILSIFVPKDPPKDLSKDNPGESKINFFSSETQKLKSLLSLACQPSFLRLDLSQGPPRTTHVSTHLSTQLSTQFFLRITPPITPLVTPPGESKFKLFLG